MNQYRASWIFQVMGSCHLQQRWIRVFLPTWTSSLPCLNPHGIWPWIFSGGDSLCLAITGWAHESHYQRWVLSSHGDLEEGSLCGYSSLLWRAACSPYLCLLLGWSFGLVLTVSYYKLKLQRILNIRFSHLKKRCDGNPEQSVLCVDDKLFYCFSSFYPSDLVLIHLHKTVFLSSCRVI